MLKHFIKISLLIVSFKVFLSLEPCHSNPIKEDQIAQGLKTRQKLLDKDLLEEARAKDSAEALKHTEFMLGRLEPKSEREKGTSLFYSNTLFYNLGYYYIFEWDQAKTETENYSIINQKMYSSGWGVPAVPNLCNSICYSFNKFIIPETWAYTENLGYYKLDMSKAPVWYCTIDHIDTVEHHRNKGIATIGIREIVDFVFSSTSVNFIITSSADNRPWSQRVFQKNGFKSTTEIKFPDKARFEEVNKEGLLARDFISLDGDDSFLIPRCYPGTDGNYYLSRFDYEARKNK